MASRNDLVTEPEGKLIRRLAIPSATGFLFNTLFNVVDSFYAGLWSTAALAALGASFPVFMVIVAAMAGFSQGTTGLVSRALGAGDEERAGRLFAQALQLAVVFGLAAAAAGLALADPVLGFLRLDQPTVGLAKSYLMPVLLAAPLFLLNAVANAKLTAMGDTRSYRNALIAGSLANIGLNPLFMFTLGLGVTGIALSTVLVQAATLVYLLARSAQRPLPAPVMARPDPRLTGALLRQSLPAVGNMVLITISLFTITVFVAGHGAAAVAAYSAALRIEQLFLLPTVGLNAAALALIGNNYGAGRMDRVARIIRLAFGAGLGIMSIGALLILAFREPLMLVFSRDPEVIAIGTQYLLVAALIQCAYGVTLLGGGTLQGLGHPILGFYVTVGRSLVAPVVLLWIVDQLLGWGLGGIFWTLFAINWTAALIMALLVRHRLRTDCGLSLSALAEVPASSARSG